MDTADKQGSSAQELEEGQGRISMFTDHAELEQATELTVIHLHAEPNEDGKHVLSEMTLRRPDDAGIGDSDTLTMDVLAATLPEGEWTVWQQDDGALVYQSRHVYNEDGDRVIGLPHPPEPGVIHVEIIPAKPRHAHITMPTKGGGYMGTEWPCPEELRLDLTTKPVARA